jgi:hypothetical protein
LYGCTSLTLREKKRLRLFENRVLRIICESKWDEVTGGWRILHEELHYLCSSPNITRMIVSRIRWAIEVARITP